LSISRHSPENQPGISRQQFLRAKTQSLHHAGAKSFDDNVRSLGELEGERSTFAAL
jgi:hypothetical protein